MVEAEISEKDISKHGQIIISVDYVCHIMFYLCIAQAIQRQLEEVSEKQRDLEERGVAIEKIIRGETGAEQYSHTQTSTLQKVFEPE